jgi:hypothetical protein
MTEMNLIGNIFTLKLSAKKTPTDTVVESALQGPYENPYAVGKKQKSDSFCDRKIRVRIFEALRTDMKQKYVIYILIFKNVVRSKKLQKKFCFLTYNSIKRTLIRNTCRKCHWLKRKEF